MDKLRTCLWFDDRIAEAANLYAGVFGGRINDTSHYPDGRVLVINMTIFGRDLMLLNGGPKSGFTEAVSLHVETRDQAETDRYWDALIADGGKEGMCGWLKDKFGLSWQIVPQQISLCFTGPADKSGRAMQAMLNMQKIVVADLEQAYAGA